MKQEETLEGRARCPEIRRSLIGDTDYGAYLAPVCLRKFLLPRSKQPRRSNVVERNIWHCRVSWASPSVGIHYSVRQSRSSSVGGIANPGDKVQLRVGVGFGGADVCVFGFGFGFRISVWFDERCKMSVESNDCVLCVG